MTKTTLLGAALVLALWAFLGSNFGFALAGGALAGASIALVVVRAQRAILVARPELALHLLGAGFLVKALLLLVVILLVRFAGTSAGFDGRTFAIAFAGALLLYMPAATIDLLHATRSTPSELPSGLSAGAPAGNRVQGRVS